MLAKIGAVCVVSLVPLHMAMAQPGPGSSPLDAATAPAADKPMTLAEAPPPALAGDELIQRAYAQLVGSFTAPAQGEQPAMHMGAAVVDVQGVPGGRGVLFEIGLPSRPGEPVRVGLMNAYLRRGELRLRVFDLVGAPGFKDAMAGLWAAPTAAPKLSLSVLSPSVDVPLKVEGDALVGVSEHPAPTARQGAIEMTSRLRIDATSIEIADAGFDAQGHQVWGPKDGEPIRFSRASTLAPRVESLEGGLTVITLVPPARTATKLAEGGELTAHYTGWLTDGTRFDTSRQQGREPFKIRIPGPVISGWNKGLLGIAKGERRRLIVPWELAYGERGRGSIPPKATLIFDVECLTVDNKPLQGQSPPVIPPPQTPAGRALPGAGTGGSGNQPIGRPPAGSGPEKPR